MNQQRFQMRDKRIPASVVPPGLRALLPIAVVVAALLPAVSFGADGPRVSPEDQLESAVLDELNLVRLEHGRTQLRLNTRLTAAADHHSLEMVHSGYFGHESANGGHFAQRIKNRTTGRAQHAGRGRWARTSSGKPGV